MREALRISLKYLCTSQLGYKDWDLVHDDIEKMLNRPGRRKLILVPRGHLKSAIVTKAMTIQQLLKNPDARILIAHEVWDKAREMLYEIKEYLTTKSQLPLVFGQFVSERWNQDEIVIKQRKKALSAPSVGTTGVEAEMTSTHYDVIIADDLQGLQNCQTKEQRDKVKRFYRSLIDLLEPGGLLIVVGTRWHQDDLYQEILDSEREYYDVMVRKVIENGKIIFPKKFNMKFDRIRKSWVQVPELSTDFIEYLKKSKGSEYYAQYENNPIDEENQIFKKNYFKYWTRRPDGLYVGMTVDLAISQKQEADYTAIVTAGMDKDFNIYLLDYVRGHWTTYEIVKNIMDKEQQWRPNVIGMETNGFQRTLKYFVEEEMRRQRHHFPIEEIRTGTQVTKEYRVKALEPYYRDGKVFHAQWMDRKDLEDELLAFPKGKHDDLIDAESMLLNLLVPGSETRRFEIPENSWEGAARRARQFSNPFKDFFNHG